jgi:uncharacterized protein YjeT (DUF2065 family)
MKTVFVALAVAEGLGCIVFPRTARQLFAATTHPRILAGWLGSAGDWVFRLIGVAVLALAAFIALATPPFP